MTSRIALVAAALLAAGAMSACATAPDQGTPIALGPIAQGAPVLSSGVSSWKTRKFRNIVRQQTDFSCGAAALATIFNHAYGRNTTERQVLVNMLKVADPDVVKERGFSLLDMKRYVQAIDMSGEGFEVDYDALLDLKVPAIALLNIKNYSHFVVIRKATEDHVHVADPAVGNRVFRKGEFEKAWNNVVFVVLGDGYDPNTVLRNPPPPLSAARMFNLRSPVRNAEVYDFGLGPAFNFVL